MAMQFRKAIKHRAKGRVAIIGPAGGGKTFTALTLARTLVGPTGKIAAGDTEHGSMEKYAHTHTCGGVGTCKDPSHFDFDQCPIDSYEPQNFNDLIQAAIEGGYDALIVDSLSHFWTGKGGALEFVDMAKTKSRDNMAGWKEFRPHERAMVDEMLAAPFHVIVTMRTKTDYQEVEENGKKKRVKVGLAPVQREGLEYEFDLVGYMDDENNFIVDKSRCFALSGKVLRKPDAKQFAPFVSWLGEGQDRPAPPAQPVQTPTPAATPTTQNGNGHHAQTPFHTRRNVIVCHALNIEARETKTTPKNPYRIVKMNGVLENGGKKHQLAFCFHQSLFDALDAAKDKALQIEFEWSKDGTSLSILNVLSVGDQEYRDGKPYTEPEPEPSSDLFPEPEPEPVGAASNGRQVNPEITDDDIPF